MALILHFDLGYKNGYREGLATWLRGTTNVIGVIEAPSRSEPGDISNKAVLDGPSAFALIRLTFSQ